MAATQQKIELMHIATMDDLNAEISRVKAQTVMQKEMLKAKLKHLPAEALKASAIAIIPGFLAARISKRGFGIAGGLLSWLFNKKEEKKEEAKKNIIHSAKQAGLYTGLSLLFNKLRKKL